MQYGELITRSFRIVWRHKYLWFLAILGGADVTTSSGGSVNLPSPSGGGTSGGGPAAASPPGAQDVAAAAGQFLTDHLVVIGLLGLLVVAVALAWSLLSCVTIGALIRGSAEHDAERPFRLGQAWRAGVATFWPVLWLRLIGLLWGLLILAVVGGFVAFGVAAYLDGQSGTLALVATLGVIVVGALLLASIPVGIALILGIRAVVLEQRGPVAALGRGFRLLGARPGRVLLVWLLQVGLALGAALVLFVLFLPIVFLLVAIVIVARVADTPGPVIAVELLLVAALVVTVSVTAGILGSYLSTYWTLAFRRMELDAPQPAWPPVPAAG